MYNASDLKKGLKIEIDGVPYEIADFDFMKPGKGQAVYSCKLKNLLTGGTVAKNYRSNDKIDEAALEEKNLAYSYNQGDRYVFLDENYEQVALNAEVLGKKAYFLAEDMEVEVLFHNGQPIEVRLPNFVEKEIVHTEPGVRGNTATNVTKTAQVEGGYEIQVPLFVNEGDVARIDTRTGEYVDRVRR